MPARHLRRAPFDHVTEQPHRGIDREAPLLLSDVLLEDVRLDRSAEPLRRNTTALRGYHVVREHDGGGSVDRHGYAHLAKVYSLKERFHVVERVDRHAFATHLTERSRRVGVVAHQRWHVKRGAEAGLPMVEQIAEAFVGFRSTRIRQIAASSRGDRGTSTGRHLA